MAAVDKSQYEIFLVESNHNDPKKRRTVDISQGVVAFTYFENIMSPTLTARVIVVNTGGGVSDDEGNMVGVYNGLPFRGGERVIIKIASNSNNNQDLDFSKDTTKYFFVSSVSDVMVEAQKEIFTLNLISREAITNETVRVGKKFPVSQKISDSVEDIIKNYLKSDKINEIDETINPYGFIGNLKKPFSIITWLASKSVCESKDNSAGFLFFETIHGFNFKSIDKLIGQEPMKPDYTFKPNVINTSDPKKDFNILKYNIDRSQDMLSKLERGAYSSERYYINPVSFKPDIRHFKSTDYLGKDGINNLGDESVYLPYISDDSDEHLGDLPTRIFVGMLDIGTIEKDASDEGWNDPIKRNADPAKIQAQSMMRYNQLFTQVVEITVPLNTNLTAGAVIRCIFPRIDRAQRKDEDKNTSGLYMIKELAHYFDTQGSYTKLKLVRDTAGRK